MMHKRVLITGLSSDSFLEFSFLSSVLLSLSLYIRWPPGLSTYRSAFPSVLPSSSCICFLQVLLYAFLRSPFLLCQFVFFFSSFTLQEENSSHVPVPITLWRKRTMDCRKIFQLLNVPHAHQKLCASPERRCSSQNCQFSHM